MKWKRQEPEVKKGDYWFNGRCVATKGVAEIATIDEIKAIATHIHELAYISDGIDYLQKYKHEETGDIIWVIDQVTKADLKEGRQPKEHNYFTILLPSEY